MTAKKNTPTVETRFMIRRSDETMEQFCLIKNEVSKLEMHTAEAFRYAMRHGEPHPGYILYKMTLTPIEVWMPKLPKTNICKTSIKSRK